MERDQEEESEGMVRERTDTRRVWFPETKGIEFKKVLNEAGLENVQRVW